ncbi:MAG TPA: hypothetical protein VE954_19485 [Oligoflexus sp.]|uniref:hypothetical protein n=1 Tax=Oligoflexus sp. TaxID=1971216 RepID=UPI002D68D9A4|nr:hypothetical protein [Oligoflexus sp.]HYX35285.1 hypothetical protein [Oligoflexus sp.]
MKKIMTLLAAGSLSIGASSASASNQSTYILTPGNQLDIDVAGFKEITLVFTVTEKKSVENKDPDVVVTETYGGFECELSSVKLLKTTDLNPELIQKLYAVDVDWFPGADSSGCTVQFLAGESAASVQLYLNF